MKNYSFNNLKNNIYVEVLYIYPHKKLYIFAVFLFVIVFSSMGVFERLELMTYDTWFKLRGNGSDTGDIVLIAIDDKSIRELGMFPWPRKNYGMLLNELSKAKIVGFDIIFDTPGSSEDNALFAKAIKDHGRVVLASMFSFINTEEGCQQIQIFPIRQLIQHSVGIGFTNIPEDQDGVVRRLTTVDSNAFKGRLFPSFSLAVLLAEQGLTPDDLQLKDERTLISGNKEIPIGKNYQILLDFNKPGSFKTYSFIDVLNGRIDQEEFAEKIVLIGSTSAAMHDYKVTPFNNGNLVLTGVSPVTGVEIHATAIKTFLAGINYKRAPIFLNMVFLFIIGTISILGLKKFKNPVQGLMFLFVYSLFIAVLVYLLWYNWHYWLNLVAPVLLVVLNYTSITADSLIHTEIDKRRIRTLFARYVSPEIVEEILNHSQDIKLGGVRTELTVLFSDIRGFTSFCESKEPEIIVRRLNEYLTEMTSVIFKYGGTVDKYIGDGIMAFFGAPIFYEDHADRALLAASEMVERLEILNKKWLSNNETTLKIGIGLDAGQAVVGNIGSAKRMDYTVIGEIVNIASRLQSLSKDFHTDIIFSDRVVKYLKRESKLPFPVEYVSEAVIRGMNNPVSVYIFKHAITGTNNG